MTRSRTSCSLRHAKGCLLFMGHVCRIKACCNALVIRCFQVFYHGKLIPIQYCKQSEVTPDSDTAGHVRDAVAIGLR